MTCACCGAESAKNAARDAAASPACALMAAVTIAVKLPDETEPSCSMAGRVRRFHSGGVFISAPNA